MGLRGIGAKPLADKYKHRPGPAEYKANLDAVRPWAVEGLSRSERVIAFLETLPISSGSLAGTKLKIRDWQKRDIIEPIYATDSDGLRYVREAIISMPRKQGKTAIVAGLALCHLCGPEAVQRGQVMSGAADRDQASLVFNVAAQMIRNDAELEASCEIVDSQKRIVHRASGSVYRAISSEAYSKHGFNCSLLVYDELHAAPNRELWDVLTSSQGARTQPLTLAISTAGYDRHSILWELYQYACKVRDGIIDDPTFLPILYEAPLEADWLDEAVWKAANPALGDFRSLEEMQVAARRAKEIPAQENAFRRLYLNQWTEQAERWISMPTWDLCKGEAIDVEALGGHPCYLGLDVSATQDLTALVALFPAEDDSYTVVPFFWIPDDRLDERIRRDRVPYDQWKRDGFLQTTPGNTIGQSFIREKIHACIQEFDVREIAYDPWNAVGLIGQLSDDGLKDQLFPIRQGYASLSSPTKALETLILTGQLHHGGHPVLRWNVSNVACETDPAGNIKPSKAASTARIDGVVALIMALDRASRHAHDDGPLWFERGIVTA